MSFPRLIYWTGLLGGWSAFVAWLFCEVAFGRWLDGHWLLALFLAVLMGALVAAAIGGGVSQASGLVTFRWQDQLLRLAFGLAGGFIGGLIGSLIGNAVFTMLDWIPFIGFVGRVLGWTFMGAVVGVVEGVYDRSLRKIRNGFIGGAAGGFLGGLLFNPISFVIGSPVSSRAIAFVLLGMFVGVLVGLLNVVMKEAWLTVQEGFRPGRQLILGGTETTMGTSEKANLIFIAFGAKGVEPIHLRIVREGNGAFVLHDNQSRGGTFLNGEKLAEPTRLQNGDVIQLGVNVVQFGERFKNAGTGDRSTRTPKAVQRVAVAAESAPPVHEPRPVSPAPVAVARAAAPPHAVASPRVAAKPLPAKPVAVIPAPAVSPPAPPKVPVTSCPVCDYRSFTPAGTGRRCNNCGTMVY